MPALPNRNLIASFKELSKFKAAPEKFLMAKARESSVNQFWLGPSLVTFVNDPELIRQVLQIERKHYNRSKFMKKAKVVFGDSLLAAEGDDWRQRRLAIQPLFSRQPPETRKELIEEVVDRSLSRLVPGEVDASALCLSITIEVLTAIIFGKGVKADTDLVRQHLETLADVLLSLLTQPAPIPTWLPTPANRKLKIARSELVNQVERLVTSNPELPKVGIDEYLTLYISGFETTASTLINALALFAANPQLQSRLRENPELTPLFINELVRLYPPIWLQGFSAKSDRAIGDFSVPKGSTVWISQFTTHRLPELWDEPEQFKIDRFHGETKFHEFQYFPFGGGLRSCIGRTLATEELEISIKELVKRFEISRTENSDLVIDYGFVARPRPLRVNAAKIS